MTPTPSSSSGSQDYIPGVTSRAPMPSSAPAPELYDLDSPFPERIPPTLVLRSSPPPPAKFGSLAWLTNTLGLDLHGQDTLSNAARTDMHSAALILAIIFVFDVFTWGLLIYFLVNGGSMNFRILLSPFALLGILPAGALLIYERGFMTTDLSDTGQKRWRVALALGLRCLVILIGAIITAQPVELMTFADRIDRRIHEERLREAVLMRAPDLVKAMDTSAKAPGGKSAAERHAQEAKDLAARIAVLKTDLAKAEPVQTKADAEVLAAQRAVADAGAVRRTRTNRLAQAETAGEPTASLQDAVDTAEEQVSRARNALNEKLAAAAVAAGKVKKLTDELKALGVDLENTNVRGDMSNEGVRAEADVQTLKNWVMTVRNLEPGTPFIDPLTKTEIVFPDYDFLDKLRIIDDLRQGKAPRWPGGSEEDLAAVKKQFGLQDPTEESRNSDAWNASRTYWAVFFFALVVPFTSLLFKLIMPAHLSLYYSHDWQSRQGNGWSIDVQSWNDQKNARGGNLTSSGMTREGLA
jgi:hypothetical protein